MSYRTWSATGGRVRRRWTTVLGLVALAVVAVAGAAFAWFPGPSSESEPEPGRAPAPTSSEGATDTASPSRAPMWHCPVDGRTAFRDDFGYRKPSGRVHRGVDLYAARGTPVVAPQPGRVEQATGGTAGKQVVLHGEGRRYVFAHLDRFAEDGTVEAGDVVGYVGTSGNARGSRPHLHFEIRGPDGPVDPFPLLDEHCR